MVQTVKRCASVKTEESARHPPEPVNVQQDL